ncbi:MAG: DedA family protein [Alphaproteobacteria bacterium]|nr:DedA family protein [Alphaproteobacteria bacterium]
MIVQGYFLLAVTAFGAATLLPFPSEPAVIALATQPGYDPVAIWLIATVANTAGSMVNWWLGRACLRWRDRRWFPAGPGQLARAERWFTRWGKWSLLLAWLPFVGDPLTVAAGILQVRPLTFLVLVGMGKAMRYAVVLYVLDAAIYAYRVSAG